MALLPRAPDPLLAPLRRLAARGWLREADVDGLLRHAHPLASLNRHYARVEARYWVADDMLALALRTAPAGRRRAGPAHPAAGGRDGCGSGAATALTPSSVTRTGCSRPGCANTWRSAACRVATRARRSALADAGRGGSPAGAGSGPTPLLGPRGAGERLSRSRAVLHYVRHPGQRAWLGELEALAARHPNLELRA